MQGVSPLLVLLEKSSRSNEMIGFRLQPSDGTMKDVYGFACGGANLQSSVWEWVWLTKGRLRRLCAHISRKCTRLGSLGTILADGIVIWCFCLPEMEKVSIVFVRRFSRLGIRMEIQLSVEFVGIVRLKRWILHASFDNRCICSMPFVNFLTTLMKDININLDMKHRHSYEKNSHRKN